MGRLNGKVALVTGGASGMGAATVRRFVEEGAKVIATDLQVEKGEALAKQTGSTFIAHDVSDDGSWRHVMSVIESQLGRLDVVFNNAGIFLGGPPIDQLDLTIWNRVISVNQTGVMLGCHYGITMMRKNPGGSSGSIINTASTSARAGVPVDAAYTATKGAVTAMTRSIAVHCARSGWNIRCNSILPGAIITGISDAALSVRPELRETLDKMSPLGRMGVGDDIAAMATFLAADESAFCTGGEFIVDGGALAGHPGM